MVKAYRQGDVLLVIGSKIPTRANIIDCKDRIILAEGEVTGHFHALPSDGSATLLEDGDKRFLSVKKETKLTHDEHGTITVPKGNYEVRRQREYQPEEIRQVAD